MKNTIPSSLFVCLLFTAALTPSAPAQESKSTSPKLVSAEQMILLTVTAKVEAIDQATREVTLKGPLGNVVTFVVDPAVKRLNQVAVGDEVTAEYYVSLAGELRAPTEEEKKTPLVVVAEAGRAPKGAAPGGGAVRAFRVVATVVGLDLPTQSLTLQGPRGNSGTIRAEHVENLKKLRLGETVLVTYTEALAISLQKSKPAKTEK